MTLTKTLAAASAVAIVSGTAATAGSMAPVVAEPVVIVEEGGMSSLDGGWMAIVAILIGLGVLVSSGT